MRRRSVAVGQAGARTHTRELRSGTTKWSTVGTSDDGGGRRHMTQGPHRRALAEGTRGTHRPRQRGCDCNRTTSLAPSLPPIQSSGGRVCRGGTTIRDVGTLLVATTQKVNIRLCSSCISGETKLGDTPGPRAHKKAACSYRSTRDSSRTLFTSASKFQILLLSMPTVQVSG